MQHSDRFQIAARLRGLTDATTANDLAAVASRLGVEEAALRISIDEDSPNPVFEVLAAAVAVYGVDPTWLLTGEYDQSVHRTAIDSGRHRVIEMITRLAGPAETAQPEAPSGPEESALG